MDNRDFLEHRTILNLRETFRTRMRERDFCIGEKEVETLFRELLGEPEPERVVTNSKPVNLAEFKRATEAMVAGMDKVFNTPSVFYEHLRRRR